MIFGLAPGRLKVEWGTGGALALRAITPVPGSTVDEQEHLWWTPKGTESEVELEEIGGGPG